VGQFCTNPGLLFVPEDERLLAATAEAIRASAGGPMLTARIHDPFSAAVAELDARPRLAPPAGGRPREGPRAATPAAFPTGPAAFEAGLPGLAQERFGPAGLVITYSSVADLLPVLARLGGNLAGVVHADEASAADMELAGQVAGVLARTVGRVVFNGWPTGVVVTSAQHHGGAPPASTGPRLPPGRRGRHPPLAGPGRLPGLPGPAASGGARHRGLKDLWGTPRHRRLTALAGHAAAQQADRPGRARPVSRCGRSARPCRAAG